MESILQAKIETLRNEMIEKALLYGSLTDEHVVEVSQMLDRYLVMYQKLIMKRVKLKLIS